MGIQCTRNKTDREITEPAASVKEISISGLRLGENINRLA